MRINLVHNRFANWKNARHIHVYDYTHVFALAAKIGIASTFITIFVQGISGFNQFCTTGQIYIYHLKRGSDLTLKLC